MFCSFCFPRHISQVVWRPHKQCDPLSRSYLTQLNAYSWHLVWPGGQQYQIKLPTASMAISRFLKTVVRNLRFEQSRSTRSSLGSILFGNPTIPLRLLANAGAEPSKPRFEMRLIAGKSLCVVQLRPRWPEGGVSGLPHPLTWAVVPALWAWVAARSPSVPQTQSPGMLSM